MVEAKVRTLPKGGCWMGLLMVLYGRKGRGKEHLRRGKALAIFLILTFWSGVDSC